MDTVTATATDLADPSNPDAGCSPRGEHPASALLGLRRRVKGRVLASTGDRSGAGILGAMRHRRQPGAPGSLQWLVLLVTASAIGLRLAFIGTQSMWSDESFTYNLVSGGLADLWSGGAREVQPPGHPLLLWLWFRVWGPGLVTGRLLGVVLTSLALVVVALTLTRWKWPATLRVLSVAALGWNGFAVVYAQDMRPYGALWAGSVLITVALVGMISRSARRDPWVLLIGGMVFASVVHPFGALLAGAAGVLIGYYRRERARLVLIGTAVGILPMVAWMIHGWRTPGFGYGTTWNLGPTPQRVGQWLFTTLPMSGLSIHNDGFLWSSPLMALIWLIVVLGAGVVWWRRRQVASPSRKGPMTDAVRGWTPGLAASTRALWLLTAAVVAGVYAVSAVGPHLWMVRNLLIVQPALSWALVLTVWGVLAREPMRVRRAGVVLLLGVLALGAATTVAAISRPYKPDVRGLTDYLLQEQRRTPGVRIVGYPDYPWPDQPGRALTAADIRGWVSLKSHASDPWLAVGQVPLTQAESIYFIFTPYGVDPEAETARLLATVTRDGRCQPVPDFVGYAVVRCRAAG